MTGYELEIDFLFSENSIDTALISVHYVDFTYNDKSFINN